MANNYILASFAFSLPAEIIDWMVEAIKLAYVVSEFTDATEEQTKILESDDDLSQVARLMDLTGYLNYEIETGGDNGAKTLTIYHDESCDVDAVMVIIQEALKHFNNNSVIGFEWAHMCDKPRIGEFGGGAMVITKDRVDSINTGTWMVQKLEEVEKAA